MKINETVKFQIGQIVYSRITPEFTGQITGICFRAGGVFYCVTWSNDLNEKSHSEIELTEEKSFSDEAKPEGTK